MIPHATMRLQLHAGFTFAHTEQLVPYMARLGVSHLYASPILTARPGSPHGYDVVDPTRVSTDLGGEPALAALVRALRAHGMGLIVDSVPNHMGIGPDNPWWMDVLTFGPDSAYAGFFDIDWQAAFEDGRPRIVLPVLGAPLAECIAKGEFRLKVGADGALAIAHGAQRFPLTPASTAGFDPNEDIAPERLADLLNRQHYRLVHWREAGDRLNWRRFFDINELAGLRIEEPKVFEAVHATLFRLYGEGLIDGFRIDHIDGLTDPRGYCRRLRDRLSQLAAERPASAPAGCYLVVEKILADREELAADWQVDGTTGYDFMSDVTALLHDPAGEEPLTALWRSTSGRAADFHAEELAARSELLDGSLKPEFERAAKALDAVAGRDPVGLRRALRAFAVHFPVYRTYAGLDGRPASDGWAVREALDGAAEGGGAALLGDLDRWLGGEAPSTLPPGPERTGRLVAIQRFQQLTAPLAAKAGEDTAFYRYGRLLSRNEVGSDPGRLALAPGEFIMRAQRRAARFPHAMLATATHDHKRGEDVRARLAVLSHCLDLWGQTAMRWIAAHAPLRERLAAPEPADAYMLYQTIVGAWPLDLDPGDAQGLAGFTERLAGWQEKALREAKLRTSWSAPDAAYEAGCRAFLAALLDPSNTFVKEAAAFVATIAPAGAAGSLAQVLIKLTTPGVPDIYQGTEFWDFSLVDPDNRRPVDFAVRDATLAGEIPPGDLLDHWRDGRLKQAVMARILAIRQMQPQLFADGKLLPLDVSGRHADRILAFARAKGKDMALVVALRAPWGLVDREAPRVVPDAWEDTAAEMPAGLRGPWRNLFSGTRYDGSRLMLGAIMEGLPIALLGA
ncbi:malto-oligosyltrehalose synthase [Pseudochelatococcus sp. B33]